MEIFSLPFKDTGSLGYAICLHPLFYSFMAWVKFNVLILKFSMRLIVNLRAATFSILALIATHSQAEGLGMVGPSGGDLVWLLVIPVGASFLLAIAMLFSWRRFKMLLSVAVFNGVWLTFGIGLMQAGPVILMLLFFPWVICLSLIVGWIMVLRAEACSQSTKTGGDPTSWPDLEHEEMSNLITAMRRDGLLVRRTGAAQLAVSKPDAQLVIYYNSIEEFLVFARKHCEKSSA